MKKSYFQDFLIIWGYIIYSSIPLNLVEGNKEQIENCKNKHLTVILVRSNFFGYDDFG